MAHANLFFSDGLDSVDPAGHSAGAVTSQVDSMIEQLNEVEDEGIRDYLAYVTLDIATVDRNLEHYPVAWALEVWERVDWGSHVRDIIGRELNLGKRQLQKLYRDRADIVSEAAKKHSPN
jgi:hypothetical protein